MHWLSSDIRIALLIAAAFSVFMVAVTHLKNWQHGVLDNAPGHARVFLVSFIALFVLLQSLAHQEGPVRVAVLLAAASFWLAALYDSRPLFSARFARIWAISLAFCAAAGLVYEVLLLVGVDVFDVERAAAASRNAPISGHVR